ncbi:MAG: flagellar hook-length control protein FliK [Pseudobutyrivibrio sp.]|nr:flagellar hook-length control protein FliK [Pseudobutyrivibrio sp.]
MTSSNVSNMLFQVSGINVEMPDAKNGLSKNGDLFETTLKNVAGPNVDSKINQGDLLKQDNQPIDAATAKLSNGKEPNLKEAEPKAEQIDDKEALTKVDEVIEKVKDVIEEKLNVSEEDLVQAMENLGLTMVDLLDPQKLAEVVSSLTGEDDSLALVLSEEFKDILDTVTELTSQMFEETGINFSDAKALMESVDQNLISEEIDSKEVLPTLDTDSNELELAEEVVESEEVVVQKPVIKQEVVDESKEEIRQEVAEVEESNDSTALESAKTDSNSSQSNNDNADESFESKAKVTKQVFENDSQPVVRTDGVVFAEPKLQVEFSLEEQIVSLPTGETVSSEEIVNQLVEQARILSDAESTTMEMTLNPEGLGRIFMEVTQKGDEIIAKIFTENDAVKQALESQMANLRTEMTQNSTKVTSIEVSVGTHEFERNLEEDARGNERREEQANQSQKRSSKINLNSLDELSGLMSEEDMLIAQIMKDNGNTLDFQA